MFKKVLIANRGEIACRIIRTLDRLGIASVAVYSDADAHSLHVSLAGESVNIGPAPANQSYLRGDVILEAAAKTGAQAIHPGYGFLSENADFADECKRAGIIFIGPTGDQMRSFGLKHTARQLAQSRKIPLLPGTDLLASAEEAKQAAARIGYPVMLKSTAGGGGIGMRLCHAEAELSDAFDAVQRLGKNNFKHTGIYLEKYVQNARHIEVQIFGDGKGAILALGERDCSTQRRNQKVIEETPAPGISTKLREQLFAAAIALGQAAKYQSAGTVEFIVDADTESFYFLEVNTRLQVEHAVTEEVTGIDLVEWMIKQAANELPALDSFHISPKGASIQVRLYAEDPAKNFQPCSGFLQNVEFPTNARIETWVERGSEVTAFYDPLIAKIIVKGSTREAALKNLQSALAESHIAGIETNLDYLRQILNDPTFRNGKVTTQFLSRFKYAPNTIDILKPGTQTTVQDYPGRIGYWSIGVPPSGPMDSLAFRLGNRIVGNPDGAAGLELTATGPTLRFNIPATIALTGAAMEATINGQPTPYWQAIEVSAGTILEIKSIQGPGTRAYLSIRNGIDVPPYLNSKATFTLGKFGGHAGRPLRTGDVLRLQQSYPLSPVIRGEGQGEGQSSEFPKRPLTESIDPNLIPKYSNAWQISVTYGPHGAPDFFTQNDIDTFFQTPWKVHYNSDRTGVRLIGPHPTWARKDGGEAGLHPSNIHDNAYAIGTVDFTGNMPVILGPDGPSLGGFVCPATIVQSELWKMGQLRPGDTIHFHRVTIQEAMDRERTQDEEIKSLKHKSPDQAHGLPSVGNSTTWSDSTPIIHRIPGKIEVVYRQDGDKYLLLEYGPLVLDLNLRFRVHAMLDYLQANPLPGIIDLTPGIRSLHIHYDSRILSPQKLLDALIAAESKLPDVDHIQVPTRIVHLPLSWDDPATQLAIQKYTQSVRPDAPWCPSNIEFIRRINGLDSIEEVKKIVYSASYLVLGLGDVYLGAPVATPIDPRHRLVTTKYNPARTWTPENAVGIGGAYLCVYGMEGPGGYQFVGRTCQMWNTHKQTADFKDGKPWLLRFFDQIRFYPISAPDLLKFRADFLQGKVKLDIQEETFSLKQYNQFLSDNQTSIAKFKTKQQAAFDAERARWEAAGTSVTASEPPDAPEAQGPTNLPQGWVAVFAEVPGNMWKIDIKKGQKITSSSRLAIIESMKMEIPVQSPANGEIADIFCAEGKVVSAGQLLFSIKPEKV
ncbi:MAG TPA: urea carboxylase [Tepidisphaeraceae bacterium]|jgi:urea carboxylase